MGNAHRIWPGDKPVLGDTFGQLGWALVMGVCFAFIPGAVAVALVGSRYGRTYAVVTFAGIALVVGLWVAWSSLRESRRDRDLD